MKNWTIGQSSLHKMCLCFFSYSGIPLNIVIKLMTYSINLNFDPRPPLTFKNILLQYRVKSLQDHHLNPPFISMKTMHHLNYC